MSKTKTKDIKQKSKKKVESVKAETITDNDDPSWYHYLTVIAVIVGVIIIGYYAISFIDSQTNTNPVNNDTFVDKDVIYKYVIGSSTYNIHFESDTEDLDALDYEIMPERIDILNTMNFRLAFKEYNGTDNGDVTVSSTKMVSFLSYVYKFSFTNESFVRYNETNCSSSTLKNKIIVLDPYQNETGVFMEDNGCINMYAQNSKDMRKLTDKLIWELIKEDESSR